MEINKRRLLVIENEREINEYIRNNILNYINILEMNCQIILFVSDEKLTLQYFEV